tara:strand:- start:1010 stop:1486 length:477 start_codon:yes stop_codon:yes gene_type:complete
MSIFETLREMNMPGDSVVSLSLSEGTDVFVHNESEVETALTETTVVSEFAELVSTKGLEVTTAYGTNVLDSLRDDGLLDDYDREGWFSDYLTETMNDNFYDLDLIEYSTEKYDYKRGFCTLTADVRVTLENLLDVCPPLTGWDVQVKTPNGTLTVTND